jgi:dTDP-4-dehydrorhamnose reductase
MKAIITGASGTVGSALKAHIEREGGTAIAWDRTQTPIDDYGAMEAFVRQHQPDALFHLAVASQSTGRENEGWLVTYHWTGELAWICRQLGVRFVFTSTVMVYTDDAKGPFTPETVADTKAGYGYDKLKAEERAFYQNPDAVVARLGWQIGDAPGTNNMIDFFEREMEKNRQINASRKWYPSCSFVEDSAALLTSLSSGSGGLYLVNSNTRWTFYEIATALNHLHGNRWKIVPNDDFVYDQRMIDERVPIAPLNARLPDLST